MGFVAARWRRPTTCCIWTSGAWAGARSAAGSPGSWSAVTSTRRTRSSPCRRCCSAPARPASSPCRTPSSSTRWCSWCSVRLWSVSHRHGFVTPADFVRAAFGIADDGAAGGDHRHRGDHAVHRAAAGRYRGGAEDDGAPGCVAADPGVRDPGRLHLPVGAAGAGADRVRQGHPDLRGDPGRDLLPAVQAGRLGRHLRRGRREVQGHPVHDRRHPSHRRQPAAVHHPGVRLGAGAVPLPAQHHRRTGQPEPRRDQAQHVGAAGLQPAARPDRAARVHGDRGQGDPGR